MDKRNVDKRKIEMIRRSIEVLDFIVTNDSSSALIVNMPVLMERRIRFFLKDMTEGYRSQQIQLCNNARIYFSNNIKTLKDTHRFAGLEYEILVICKGEYMESDAILYLKAGLRSYKHQTRLPIYI